MVSSTMPPQPYLRGEIKVIGYLNRGLELRLSAPITHDSMQVVGEKIGRNLQIRKLQILKLRLRGPSHFLPAGSHHGQACPSPNPHF